MEDDEAKEHQQGKGNVSKRNRSSAKKTGHKVENKRFNLAFGGRHDEERGEKRNCVVSRRVEVFSSSACDSVSECGAHARAQSDAAGSAAPLFETARPMVSASSIRSVPKTKILMEAQLEAGRVKEDYIFLCSVWNVQIGY